MYLLDGRESVLPALVQETYSTCMENAPLRSQMYSSVAWMLPVGLDPSKTLSSI